MRWRDGEPLDISSLAVAGGQSRATAYRWFGDNDQLLAEVLRSRTDDLFETARKRHAGEEGAPRIIGVLRDYIQHVAASSRFKELLDRDPQRVMTIVASGAFPNQMHVISLVQTLVEEELDSGTIAVSGDAYTVACAMARISEAFLYAGVLAGEQVDLDAAIATIRPLLLSRE